MSKNIQMSIKMEPELHDQFMAVAATIHTPAAQVVRKVMLKFIALHEKQNTTTMEAMKSADRGEGTRFESADDLFKDLGI